MKIALILSGLNRSASHTYPYYFENLIKNNDVDVYFHTYYQTQVSVKNSSIQEKDDNNINFILDNYKPKKYLIEDYNNLKESLNSLFRNYEIQCDPERTISMFYGMKTAFDLVEEDKYDIYIRSRFDLIINNPLIMSNYNSSDSIYIPNPTGKSTYTPDGIDYYSYVNDSYGIIDSFAMGSYQVMNTYFKCYDKLNDYCLNHKLFFHPEYLTLKNILFNNININRFNMDFYLYRKMF